jgi:hypothetical protein
MPFTKSLRKLQDIGGALGRFDPATFSVRGPIPLRTEKDTRSRSDRGQIRVLTMHGQETERCSGTCENKQNEQSLRPTDLA